MSVTFRSKLVEASTRNQSLLCVGLDPDPSLIPANIDVATFNCGIIEATKDLVCAYKPNLAFYEAQGMNGLKALQQTDVFVSTARHEFFGISVVEAIAAGAYPLVPRSLAYPDVLQLEAHPQREQFFYDGSPADLADRLCQLADSVPFPLDPSLLSLRESTERFDWPVRAAEMDALLGQLAATPV